MRMVGAVERAVGVRVPIRAVFVAPRLADFAAAIATAEASVRRQTPRGTPGEGEAIRGADSGSAAGSDGLRSLVPLQPLGDRTPLVFCHGAGGGLSHFLPSVGKLAPDIPVWGILARDFEGGSAGEAAMHDLVTGYADEIERFRPWGAVNLGGLSLGGWFAWEVAVELRRRGREIGTVILLDTHPRARLPWKMRLRLVVPRIATFVERNLVWAGKLARGHLPRVVRRGLRRVGVPLAALPPQEDALPVDRMVSLVERHLTGPSPVRVDLVRALHPSRVIVPHWRLLAGDGLRVHPFRSPHHHIHLPENADALAALIRSIVDDVEADARGGRRLEKDCSTGCPSSPPSSAPTPAVRPPG
jgi:thioesterase domain-containing protein